MRESRYGAYEFVKQDTERTNSILSADVRAKIKRSFGNSVVIPVLDYDDVTIGNVRSCTIADDENNSALVTLTFVTYAFGFTMTPSQHFNNDVSYQADYDRKLKKYLVKFASLLDTAAISLLETNKNIYAGTLANYYPFTGNALQVTDAQKNDFYNQLETIMMEMDFYDKTHVVTSTSGMPLVNRLANQGAGNQTNEQWQLNGYAFHPTNRITVPGGSKAVLYAVQEGSTAVENRNDPDAIMGSRIGDHLVWEEVEMPIVNMKMASFYREDCGDVSGMHAGTSKLTRAKKEGYEFSTDVVFVSSYNSAPASRYSPILKAVISAT